MLELLLRNWDARRFKVDEQGGARQDQPSLSEYLAVGPDRVRAVLERLAFEVHRDQDRPTGTADIAKADLLLPGLPEEGPLPPEDAWGARLAGQILLESTEPAKASRRRAKVRDRIRDGQLAVMRRSTLPAPERAAAGDCLSALGDTRFDPDRWYLPAGPLMGFVPIPASAFTMGSDKAQDADTWDNEQPQHRLKLPDYWIAHWPVTVAQFRAFVEASGYAGYDERAVQGPDGRPVAYVTWYDARSYCAWLDCRLREVATRRSRLVDLSDEESALFGGIAAGNLRAGLPSEPEWEKAARGTDARRYPWGKDADTERANYDMTRSERPASSAPTRSARVPMAVRR